MKLFLLVSVSVFSLCTGIIQTNHQSKSAQKDKTKPFMRAKLAGSQKVLDGLVTENFTLIYRGAESMKKMSEAVQWPHVEDKVYEHYGHEFRRQCDKLMKFADQQNHEGAHFTYLNMTTTCINCHNYVRGAFRVEKDADNPQGPVRLIPTEWDRQESGQDRAAKSDWGRDPN